MPKFDRDGITSAMRSRTAMGLKLTCDAMKTGLRIYDAIAILCDTDIDAMRCDDDICDAMRCGECGQSCDGEQ